jgi:protein-L-isoaspartate(D-aspartate) O-methyltransferase
MTAMNIEPVRDYMIYHQIRPWDVSDKRVLRALAETPREQFVPAEHRQLAFADTAIPLPCGQTMLKPILEGRLLQALQAQADQRVLVIGTGSGFLTACVAALSAQVVSVDIHAELVDAAAVKFADEKIRNVELQTIDFNTMNPASEFDRILVTGSMPQFDARLPEWLTDAGRLIMITGNAPSMQVELVTRTALQYTREQLFETVIPPLENVPVPQAFRL